MDHALAYAAGGWSVFPAIEEGPKAKAPYRFAGTLEHGHLDATRDAGQIVEWWTLRPRALIASAVPDSLLALDLDPRRGETYERLVETVGTLPKTLTAWSGRNDGGRHLYFLRPPGELTSTRLPADLKIGGRGYLIMPPSLHPVTGLPYVWEEHEIAAVPTRLRELLRVPPTPARRVAPHGDGSRLVRFVAALTEGERNRALYWAACRAAEEGTLGSLEGDLVSAAVGAGLSEREARRVIESAGRKAGAR